MPDNEVFIDSSAMLAMISRTDVLHPTATALNRQFLAAGTPLVTSDWVLAEFLCVAARPMLRTGATKTIALLKSTPRATIVEATRSEWERAFDFFERYSDKAWSFVDCSSMLICQDRGIRRVFTYDHHFRQFGLEALLRR